MKKKPATSYKTRPEVPSRSEWNLPDTKKLELRYDYGDSVIAEFVAGHDHAAVLRELVQNEYDADGSRLRVVFDNDKLHISGNGKPIDANGWKRLSVMLGTGQIGKSDRTIAKKVNGIGSKNFGLRSLFLYGDQIHIRSGGLQTVLDFSRGTLQAPEYEPYSKHLPGIEIVVPYRERKHKNLEPFDIAREKLALESFVTDLTSTLMKLAQPEARKSLHQVEISSIRCERSLVLKQSVRAISQQNGITAVRRTIHVVDSKPSDSQVAGHTIEEIEFQRVIHLPQQYRDQTMPGYYKVPGSRIRLAVSLRMYRKKIDLVQPGHFFYPLEAAKAYTGNALSINAPFQMNVDRSQIINPSMNEFNNWLIDRATDLTFDLLASDRWKEFGPERYLALQEQTHSENIYFLHKVTDRLEKDACWPTRDREKGLLKHTHMTSAAEIVVPTHPMLDGFLPASHYLDGPLGNDPRVQIMVKKCGAKAFGINSFVRLRCAGSEKTKLATQLASYDSDNFYPSFPNELKDESLQRKFAHTLDVLASHLSKQNREDLKKSPTTLAADGSLQAPEKLWVFDSAIAFVFPIPASEQLHPTLIGYKTLTRLCQKYDAKIWVQTTAQQVQDGTASEAQRNALYTFILAIHGHLDRKTWAILRKTQVLRDHRNEWITPISITLRKAIGASQLEAVLHFPHPDYEDDKELAQALRFKKKVTGEDIVKYAPVVVNLPSLAPKFEETLQKFSRLLTKQELERLSTIAFLRSSQGGLTSPSALYLHTPGNLACLGDDAMFVAGSRIALYERLGCLDKPKVADVLSYLTKLRGQGVKPKQPEILYPTLVEALKSKKPLISYQSQPIIWDGMGYSKPTDMLLSGKFRSIFLQSVPQLEGASPELRQALKSLGVPTDPQPQHWQKLFAWFSQRYAQSEAPLNQIERHALLNAYNYLQSMIPRVPDNIKYLLDQDGRLHSQTEMRAERYLLNDDPALAEALMKNGTSPAFADTRGTQGAKALRFYQSIGVHLLTEVREQISVSIGAEKKPPPWGDSTEIIEKLHDPSFLSALASLAAHQLQEYPGPTIPPIPQLQTVRSLTFAQPLHIEYRVGSVTVLVSTDVVLDHERFVLAEAQSRNELDELLSQAIASLFVRIPAEQHRFANAVYRVLTCSLPSEMANFLRRQGIAWEPPAFTPDTEVTHLDDEFSNFVTTSQSSLKIADTMLNDETNKDRQIVQEVIKHSITNQLGRSHTISTTTFSSDHKEIDTNLTKFSSSELVLPPIESVIPKLLGPLGSQFPVDSDSRGTERKGYRTLSTSVDEEYKIEVGHRGEEIIFLHEVERVERLGYSKSRVVWIANENALADYDILSVDEDGTDLWLEVKSTTGRHGHFLWSIAELEKAMQVRKHYILWRVYDARTIHPSIKSFRDPIDMLIHNSLRLNIASLSAEVEPL